MKHIFLGALAFLVQSDLPDSEFVRLRRELDLKSRPWATIPWQVSIREARERAAREKKPVFLNVNTGNLLGVT